MVWHIFRKDLRLMWPLVALVAVLQFACAGVRLALGHFADPPQLVFVADLLSGAMFVGAAILIISTMQQDTVPGVNQDWLVRPIKRGDLIVAKLLFLLLALQGPMLIADLSRAFAAGIPAREAIPAALSRSVVLFLTFDLPMAAIATITATAIEAIGAVLAIWLLVLVGLIVGSAVRGGAPPFAGTGMQWMIPAYWSLLALATATIVIPLQFFRRSTVKARRIVLAATILAPLLSFSSWSAAFAVQRQLSSDPGAGQAIEVAFDPALGKAPADGREGSTTIALPLQVSGLPTNSILRSDRSIVHLYAPNGETLYTGPSVDFASGVDDFPVRTANSGVARMHQLIKLPLKVLDAVRNRPVRMEIDYSLTLLGPSTVTSIEALGGKKRMAGFGWCKTRSDDEGDDIVVGCLKTDAVPDCILGVLQDRRTGHRNPEDYLCSPDYAPFTLSYLDVVHQFDGELEYHDPKGLARYPVTAQQLASSQVVLQSFRPRAHLSRRLDIPALRLSEWALGQ